MIRRSPMTRLLATRALRLILGLFVLIEAIFLTDIFTSEMEAVVRNGGNLLDFAGVMLLRTPEVVDFALPIVLFLGLYLAIGGARADNELMICAAAGERWTRVPALALVFGAAAMLVSLGFSGVLTPLSSYLLRLSYHEMAARQMLAQLSDPQARLQVRHIEDRVVIATPPVAGDGGRGGLFIFAADPSGTAWRVGKANEWDVEPAEGGVGYRLRLDGFREYHGRPVPATSGAAESEPSTLDLLPRPPALAAGLPGLDLARIDVRRLQVDFSREDLVAAQDRSRRIGERLLFQEGGPLAGLRTLPDGTTITVPTRRFGEIVARALMCVLTSAIAVAAAALAATRRGRFLGMPLGMLLVMVGDVATRTALGDAAGLGHATLWPVAGGVAALGLAPLLGYVWHRGETIVAPTRLTS